MVNLTIHLCAVRVSVAGPAVILQPEGIWVTGAVIAMLSPRLLPPNI